MTGSSRPIIELVGVKKTYDHRLILDIPSLKIEERKLHIIVGPNGSGKTTLLEILAGIENIDQGRIYYNNEEVTDKQRFRRNITLVMQSPYVLNASVFQNVAYGLKVRAVPRKEIGNRVSAVLDRLGLKEFVNRNGKKLSQGEMRKVAIARALVIDPEVLLLDEPTSDLDRLNIQLIENLIKTTKKTIIMATQSTSQAHRLAEILITIKKGKTTCVRPDFNPLVKEEI